MEQIDESKRKPRRTFGTPAYYHRNRFAIGVIAVGTVLFAAFAYTPYFRNFNRKFVERFIEPSEEEVARRVLFNLPAARTSRAIQETIDSKKQLMSER